LVAFDLDAPLVLDFLTGGLDRQQRSGAATGPTPSDRGEDRGGLPLHRLTSEARGLGITFVVYIQSRQQLDDVWTSTRGSIIWKSRFAIAGSSRSVPV
jgi:hypothetical protein